MSRIILNDDKENHAIAKYSFKSLLKETIENYDTPTNENTSVFANSPLEEKPYVPKAAEVNVNEVHSPEPTTPVDASNINETNNDDAINDKFSEELLKKVDELSGSLIKMEMNLEKQQSEFSERLDEERKLAHEQGLEIGRKEQSDLMLSEMNSQKAQLISSISKMDEIALEFDKVSQNIESELVNAAIDIAKEVLISELSNHSSEIALSLAKGLLENVKDAMAITIKAHPEDAHLLKQEFEEKSSVSIESDDAIAQGGVVIVSDAGNVNGSVMERFENVKRNLMP
jgi:flagellar assembly protein FliH